MGENIKITIFNHKIFAVLNIYLNFAFNITKVYITSKEVKVISAQGIILSKSKSGAILKMTVYQDGKEVYQNTVSVPDSENNTKSIQYTNIKN